MCPIRRLLEWLIKDTLAPRSRYIIVLFTCRLIKLISQINAAYEMNIANMNINSDPNHSIQKINILFFFIINFYFINEFVFVVSINNNTLIPMYL